MKKLLTIRKQKWASTFKPNVLVGNPLNPNMGVAAYYNQKLDALIREMVDDTDKQLKKLFDTEHAEEYFAHDASISSQARILTNALIEKYDALFSGRAPALAEYFAERSDRSSSAAAHVTLKQLSGGLSIKTAQISGDLKDIFKATIAENVALIKSIPQQYLNGVQQAVMRSITNGRGLQTLVPYLQKEHGKTFARARMISMDQTRKAFEGMTRARLERAGIKKFKWIHTGGSNEPRPLHQHTLNGKIFSYAEPPIIDTNTGERGFPGQLINCRCRQAPVIDFGDNEDGEEDL